MRIDVTAEGQKRVRDRHLENHVNLRHSRKIAKLRTWELCYVGYVSRVFLCVSALFVLSFIIVLIFFVSILNIVGERRGLVGFQRFLERCYLLHQCSTSSYVEFSYLLNSGKILLDLISYRLNLCACLVCTSAQGNHFKGAPPYRLRICVIEKGIYNFRFEKHNRFTIHRCWVFTAIAPTILPGSSVDRLKLF